MTTARTLLLAALDACDALKDLFSLTDATLTCSEADRLAALFTALGRDQDAEDFLRIHAASEPSQPSPQPHTPPPSNTHSPTPTTPTTQDAPTTSPGTPTT